MTSVPKPGNERQPCPQCRKTFRTPRALYRHALKCLKGKNRLGSTAKKTPGAEYLFDSRLEAKLFALLKLRERAGEVRDVRVKPNVRITAAGILVIPDFSAVDVPTGGLRYHEAKGFRTEVWALKMRLWRAYGPAPIDVYVAGNRGDPHLSETIPGTKSGSTDAVSSEIPTENPASRVI